MKYLLPETWLHLAKELPEGSHKRVSHDCGGGEPMVVWHDDEGWRAYCHRCGLPGRVLRPKESLSERIAREARRKSIDATAAVSLVPPMPPVVDPRLWPLAARVWLYKAGLSNDEIIQKGFYYHEHTDRVIIPMVEDGKLVAWTGRDPYWTPASTRPKYLNQAGATKDRGVGCGDPASPPVLVEDYLSATRIGDVGGYGLCLLGTKVTGALLQRLAQAGVHRVGVWLDNDQGRRLSNPGREAAAKARRLLQAQGFDVVSVVTEKDPKCYSRKEVECLLRSQCLLL